MLKFSLFKRKKGISFKNFYNNWFTTLQTTLLPQLRLALSYVFVYPNLLSTQVDAMHHHLQSYYKYLDLAAGNDVAQCLYPEWRNSLEKPFLWLGDLHPYLFINLLRSFLDDQETQDDNVLDINIHDIKESCDKRWHEAVAWRNPSKALTTRVDQIECGLRLMVPALAARGRHAQAKLVTGQGTSVTLEDAVETEMEELVGVVVDANRLRKSVLADVLSVTSVHQAALFLEALAEFLVGFRDHKLLEEFGKVQISHTYQLID